MDQLRARRERIELHSCDGLRSASYEGGKLGIQEIPPDVVRQWSDDLDKMIAWAESHATICPTVAGEDVPPVLRDYLCAGRSDIFDSLILAMETGNLLVTDDLPTREMGRLVGCKGSTWLHQVFWVALDDGHVDLDTFIRWSANFIDAGHSYIGVFGPMLTRSLQLDLAAGDAPGPLFRSLTKAIGGKGADPRSHIRTCLECVRPMWTDAEPPIYYKRATGLLLRQLLRERYDDYGPILRTMLHLVRFLPGLVEYIRSWMRGHFIPDSVLEPVERVQKGSG